MTDNIQDKQEHHRNVRRNAEKKGLVIVNTGEGKGKTTAAIGLMTRAWGRSMRVGMLQFLKNENARFGEIRAAEKMGVDIIPLGKGWTWKNDEDETVALAREGWEKAKELIENACYDILILDEFTYSLAYDWLNMDEVIDWLKVHKPEMMHIVITGRYAPKQLIEYADLVTEMCSIKHPYEKGIRAQPGIEY